ncbi:MAG: hypothetical protein NT015_07335 [Alphaproteobacteria bacterium]|nr:hypothetical protein [Alphaproteobacteria bacterium]
MRYSIEYLRESTDETSVFATVLHSGSLADTMTLAAGGEARGDLNADGYQVRDLDDGGKIVWLEHFYI